MSNKRSLDQLVFEKADKRLKREPAGSEIKAAEWKHVNLQNEGFIRRPKHPGSDFLLFNLRKTSHLQLFLRFLTPQLLERIWRKGLEDQWSYSGHSRTINHGQFSLSIIYKFFAVKLLIQALQHRPTESEPGGRKLREDIECAMQMLRERFPEAHIPAINILEQLLGHFLLTYEFSDELSMNFRSIVRALGEYLSCDEKLKHFVGNSGDIRFVPNKPAKVGIWFTEDCGVIDNNLSYLLDYVMARAHTQVGEKEQVVGAVKRWIKVVQSIEQTYPPAIVFDSYYTSKASRSALVESGILFLGSVATDRMSALQNKVQHKVKKPGDFAALYNKQTGEAYVMYWDKDPRIGKKQVFGNFLLKTSTRQQEGVIPLYDYYAEMFDACDRFNRGLHDKTWPHKQGGHGRLGDTGQQDDFAFSSALQNIINAERGINRENADTRSFRESMIDLGYSLFEYANSL